MHVLFDLSLTHFILFYFILFYFILFYFILFYFILLLSLLRSSCGSLRGARRKLSPFSIRFLVLPLVVRTDGNGGGEFLCPMHIYSLFLPFFLSPAAMGGMGRHQGRGALLTSNLPQLQNLIKRDPVGYKEEFLQQWNQSVSPLHSLLCFYGFNTDPKDSVTIPFQL